MDTPQNGPSTSERLRANKSTWFTMGWSGRVSPARQASLPCAILAISLFLAAGWLSANVAQLHAGDDHTLQRFLGCAGWRRCRRAQQVRRPTLVEAHFQLRCRSSKTILAIAPYSGQDPRAGYHGCPLRSPLITRAPGSQHADRRAQV